MIVQFEYHAQLRSLIGKSAEAVEVADGITVQQAVRMLLTNYGEAVQAYLLSPDGALRPSMVLILNEQQMRWSTPTPLHDGDHVLLLSPISGG